jgi:hypothetical protein
MRIRDYQQLQHNEFKNKYSSVLKHAKTSNKFHIQAKFTNIRAQSKQYQLIIN